MRSIHRHTTASGVRRQGDGWCAEGPGFYVWDEDPREVARVARDLRSGRLNPRPTERMLVIPDLTRPDPV